MAILYWLYIIGIWLTFFSFVVEYSLILKVVLTDILIYTVVLPVLKGFSRVADELLPHCSVFGSSQGLPETGGLMGGQ